MKEKTITGGEIKAADINSELGKGRGSFFQISSAESRRLAGKPYGEIKFSDFIGKRNRGSYFLIGRATTSERGNTYDSGLYRETWNNIPRNSRIRSRVFATTNGSHKNDGTRGYVFIRWIIKDINNVGIWSSTRIEKYTSGDGAGGIGQWSQEYWIRDLVGSGNENVNITIEKRFIAGDYQAHIDGGRHRARRIHGIESDVGY